MDQSERGSAIGLDVGTKTIGVAATDALGIAAHPVMTLKRQSVKKDSAKLAVICEERRIQHLVVGLPLELDGSEKRSARLARQVGECLGGLLELTPIYIDERFTSVDAEEVLVRLDISRKKRKEIIDQAAAVLILESWLEYGEWSR